MDTPIVPSHPATTSSDAMRAQRSEKKRLRMKLWRAQHKERLQASAKLYRTLHREQEHARQARYRAAQRSQKPARKALTPAQKVEAKRQRCRDYYQKNKSAISRRHNARKAQRRAMKRHAPVNDLTARQWEDIKAAYGYRCVYCPDSCQECKGKAHPLTQEHLTPLSKQGSHTVSNVVPACLSCNSSRGNRGLPKPVQPLLLCLVT